MTHSLGITVRTFCLWECNMIDQKMAVECIQISLSLYYTTLKVENQDKKQILLV